MGISDGIRQSISLQLDIAATYQRLPGSLEVLERVYNATLVGCDDAPLPGKNGRLMVVLQLSRVLQGVFLGPPVELPRLGTRLFGALS
ncbi:hypothetical protein A7X57_02310 [Stenotrophomonas maltophilia]|nr:hypothetical protein A7X57_02310 [Stenotrophomonas maltophilia]